MSTFNKASSTYPDTSNSPVQITNANFSEEMPATFKFPYWMQTPWFKTIKVGMCVLCFPLIYFIGKYLITLVE